MNELPAEEEQAALLAWAETGYPHPAIAAAFAVADYLCETVHAYAVSEHLARSVGLQVPTLPPALLLELVSDQVVRQVLGGQKPHIPLQATMWYRLRQGAAESAGTPSCPPESPLQVKRYQAAAQALTRILVRYGGSKPHFPPAATWTTRLRAAIRDAVLLEMFDGRNYASLAERCGLSERQVRHIIKAARPRRLATVFERLHGSQSGGHGAEDAFEPGRPDVVVWALVRANGGRVPDWFVPLAFSPTRRTAGRVAA